ncbi:D-Ala-D-Ala carboxypeptidase family metallohydrolase [Microbulbifer sp. SAOS-129_SWC]|uniref:D-Ala-D-Ala carboxypeptidase family metallohydrolase n=1 Tax=Microbulbifer sp. SAOS-129_SWC TaxID=3145235 RepID=UPI003217FB80
MPHSSPSSTLEFYFRPQPCGRYANRWVIASISLLLIAVLATLWLYLYTKTLNKPFVDIKGYRVPTQESFERFLRQGDHRAQFRRLEDYLQRSGVGDAIDPRTLLRQGTDWLDYNEPAFAIAPKSTWRNMVATLALLRDEIVPAIGPVTVLSAYRSANYNRRSGGASTSRHRDFCGLDLVPQSNISRKELGEELKALHARLGPESNMGLGLSTKLRFHIDTCGYRSW